MLDEKHYFMKIFRILSQRVGDCFFRVMEREGDDVVMDVFVAMYSGFEKERFVVACGMRSVKSPFLSVISFWL